MKFIYLFIVLITVNTFSQKLKIKEGNLDELKGVISYNLEFDYHNLEIINYASEEVFLKEKVKRKSKIFKTKWFSNRKNVYQPFFESTFNNYFIKKKKITVSEHNTDAKYTILVKSLKLYPGYNVTMAWESAKLWAEVVIYKTKHPKQIVFRSKPIKIYQGYYDMNMGKRIANAYGVLAQTTAKFLKKKTLR